jgi:phytoene synthase
VPLLDTRSASCVLAMTGIYRRVLERIDESPELVMRQRVSLPGWEKAWVAARSLVEAAA